MDKPETQRAREALERSEELLKSSAAALERVRNRSLQGGARFNSFGVPIAESSEPQFSREAQSMIDRQDAERKAREEAKAKETGHLAARLRKLETELALAQRANRSGYLRTDMPGVRPQRGRR